MSIRAELLNAAIGALPDLPPEHWAIRQEPIRQAVMTLLELLRMEGRCFDSE